MMPVLNIGPLAIQLPGLLMILGLWLGINLAEKSAHTNKTNPNDLYNLVFFILIGAIISARLAFIANYPSAFTSSPKSVFSLNPELLDTWGGIAGGILVGVLFIESRKMRLLLTLDALVPVLAVLVVFMALANFASGDSFGSPTNVPWGIPLWGTIRHPTQVYQAGIATIILVLMSSKRTFFIDQPAGVYFLVFISATAASRLFLEYFHGDSFLLPGGFRAPQLAAWIILATCLWGIHKLMMGKSLE